MSSDPDWATLERGLGVSLPDDYKRIVARYAPVQLNVHLYLHHPSTVRWNLGRWMDQTATAFARSDLTEAKCPGFPQGPLFGGPEGLIPLTSTDRGEYLFGAADTHSGHWRILACNGDEQDFYEYRMPFSEWLYCYLAGESMFGPGSAVFYPGPILFEGAAHDRIGAPHHVARPREVATVQTLHWQKSTYSAEAANCVYVAASPTGTIHLRESDEPEVILTTTAPSLHALIRSLAQ